MDYNQEQFFRMQQNALPKMPFYMSYPMQNLYLTEMEYEKDVERMKELYPKEAKRILEYVEEECDKMEYEGSLMFDEYPDRLMLEMVVDRIYDAVNAGEDFAQAEEIQMEQRYSEGPGMPPPPPGRPGTPPPKGPGMPPPPSGDPGRPPRDETTRSLIGVLLNNEMYRRRCRHRRCRRWW